MVVKVAPKLLKFLIEIRVLPTSTGMTPQNSPNICFTDRGAPLHDIAAKSRPFHCGSSAVPLNYSNVRWLDNLTQGRFVGRKNQFLRYCITVGPIYLIGAQDSITRSFGYSDLHSSFSSVIDSRNFFHG